MITLHPHRTMPAAARGRALLWCTALVVGMFGMLFATGGNPATPAAARATVALQARAATCTGATYTVVSGDSWSGIAARANVTLSQLLAANNATTARVIHPGDVLCLPTGAITTTTRAPSTLPSGAVPIKQFPAQGLCGFIDTFGAPRSGGRTHEGVDIIAAAGKYVYAVDDGVLSKQFLDAPGSLSGNGWRLLRADGTYFMYAHLSAFAPNLAVGSRVVAGQIIGLVGMTGNAGSPHLHFEVHPGGGSAIDPTPTVKAVNGCNTSAVPAQPGETPTITVPATQATTPATQATTPATQATAPPTTAKPRPPRATTTTSTTTTTTTLPPTTTTEPPTTTTVLPQFARGYWQFVEPITVLDTSTAELRAGQTRTVGVVGQRGLLATTDAVMVRVTLYAPTRPGDVSFHSCAPGASRPVALHYAPGRINAVVVPVTLAKGQFCVTSTTDADVRLDVIAYQADGGVGSNPVDARRALDTRLSAPLEADMPMAVLPEQLATSAGARAVTLTVTLLDPAGAGNVAIGGCGETPWTLPFAATSVQSFSAVVPVDDSGLCVSSTTPVDVVIDVTGVWTAAPPMIAVSPARVYDSHTTGQVTDTMRRVPLALPAGATRVQLLLTLSSSSGALWAWDCSHLQPIASAAYTTGAPVSVVLTVSVTDGELCLASSGSLQVTADLLAVG